ncbi:MAG: DUF4386 domain-containing protein [Candidatus Limnocylindria bacterium]
MAHSITAAGKPDVSQRGVALIAALGLLGMAVLAPLALFGVLETLVDPGNATATVSNIVESEGLFRLAIAAFLVVAFLDVLVAWALYVLLRPVNGSLAMLVGWLRLAAAAASLPALANLLDVAQLLGGPVASTLPAAVVEAQVMASVASFHNAMDIHLAVFGLHLLGVGVLVYKSVQFPRFLGVLVVIAGVGYLGDTFTRILVPDFDFTFSLFTFVGEALLIVWFLWRAIKGFTEEPGTFDAEATPETKQPAPVAS